MIFYTYNRKANMESDFKTILKELYYNGVEGIRLNLCQYSTDKVIGILHELLEEFSDYKKIYKLMIDLPYPYNKSRVIGSTVKNGSIIKGEEYVITYSKEEYESFTNNCILITKPNFYEDNSIIFYADGEGGFEVCKKEKNIIIVKALWSWSIFPNKSLSLGLKMEKESFILEVISAINEYNIPVELALSFVTKEEELCNIRKYCNRNINIIAKIETSEACKNYENIVDASDGIVLARGDMALLYSISDLYWKCKEVIEYAKYVKKIYI